MKEIQWFPGHMQKAKREIKEKLKLVNIVYIVVDARLPYSSFNPILLETITNKPVLVLINKADMADPIETKKWLKYYHDIGYHSLDIDAVSRYNIKKIIPKTKEILKEVIKKNKLKGIHTSLRSIIIGIPNVGKSTIINTMVKKKVSQVGDKPGVTKAQQWIRLDDDIDLLDTPGVLWPKFDTKEIGLSLALSGAIKDTILPIDDVVAYGFDFLIKYYKKIFFERYKMDIELPILDIYEHIGKIRGCLLNKDIDYERVNRLFINDIRKVLIGRITFDRYDKLI